MKTPNVAAEADASTRQRVASSILEHGPSTAVALAGRLGLTPAAVRRHLDVLLASAADCRGKMPRSTRHRRRNVNRLAPLLLPY